MKVSRLLRLSCGSRRAGSRVCNSKTFRRKNTKSIRFFASTPVEKEEAPRTSHQLQESEAVLDETQRTQFQPETFNKQVATRIIGDSWRSKPHTLDKAFEAYKKAKQLKAGIDILLIDRLVYACRRCDHHDKVMPLWQDLVDLKLLPDMSPELLGQFAHCAGDAKDLKLAISIFNCITQEDVFLKLYYTPQYTVPLSLLDCFLYHESIHYASQVFDYIRSNPILKNQVQDNHLAHLLKCSAEANMMRSVGLVHSEMVKYQYRLNSPKLISSIIALLSKNLQKEVALEFFQYYQALEYPFDNFDYTHLISMCRRAKDLDLGKQFHRLYLKSGNQPDEHLVDNLVYMYTTCGDVQSALTLYNRMKQGNKPSQFMCTQILGVCDDPEIRKSIMADMETIGPVDYKFMLNSLGNYVRSGNTNRVKEGLELMNVNHMEMDNRAVAKLLKQIEQVHQRDPEIGMMIIERMKKDRVEPDSITGMMLTKFYMHYELYEEVEEMFGQRGDNFDDGVHQLLLWRISKVRNRAAREKLMTVVRPHLRQNENDLLRGKVLFPAFKNL